VTDLSERESLADEIERHIRVEDAILQDYHALSDKLPDGPLAVLINQVTTEEEMHHFLLATLAGWLRSAPDEGPSTGSLGADRGVIIERARLLQQHEQETIRACEGLKSKLKGEQGDLYEALLDVLILDSQKHHRLLQALEKVASG
jgi:rubrerythrin